MSDVFTSSPGTTDDFKHFDSNSPLSSLGSSLSSTPVREYKSDSSFSSPASPTIPATFRALGSKQRGLQNITTYAGGKLLEVAYPLDPTGKVASASLVWQMLETHEMPRLSCFHEEKATTHAIGNKTYYVARCKYKKDGSCGYFVNFTKIAGNPNILKQQYPLRVLAADVDTVENRTITTPEKSESQGLIITPASDTTTIPAVNIPENNIPSSSPGPVRSRRNTRRASPVVKRTRKENGGASDNSKSACRVTANGTPLGDETSGLQAAAPAAPSTLIATIRREPKSIEELLIALQSDSGVAARTFDKFIVRCGRCAKVIKLLHRCIPFIDLTLEEDEEDGVVETSEPETEIELVYVR